MTLAFDEMMLEARRGTGRRKVGVAFDRDTVRSFEPNSGRMHVAVSNISAGTINPYLGKEINDVMKDEPGWQMLEPDRIYKMLRHPDELAKAAHTFNNIPLMLRHVRHTVESPHQGDIIGSTGTDAEFSDPFLRNSLVVWTKEGIDAIESEDKKELSIGYHYKADMTPGIFEGESYDGVMRDLCGNHVSIVEEGRAGPNVVVADSNQEVTKMSGNKAILTRKAAVAQGALLAYLRPKLATDAKIDLTPALAKTNARNFKANKSSIAAEVQRLSAGKLAKDATVDLQEVAELLNSLDAENPAEGLDMDPNTGLPMVAKPAKDSSPDLRTFLKGKLSEDDVEKACSMAGGAKMANGDEDETEEEKADREKKEKEAKDKGARDKAAKDKAAKDAEVAAGGREKDMVTQQAMDSALEAIQASTAQLLKSAREEERKNQREVYDARTRVRPIVGELSVAFDTAAEVYGAALKLKSVNTEGVPPAAFRAMFEMLPAPGRKDPPRIGADNAGVDAHGELEAIMGRKSHLITA